MRRFVNFGVLICGAMLLTSARDVLGGTITASGSVNALTNVNQLNGVIGTANFDEGPLAGGVPLNAYSAQGLTFQFGDLSSFLPGVTTDGFSLPPFYQSSPGEYFPGPIAGGGVQNGQAMFFGSVATFDSSVDVTQFGLTASKNGNMFLTAWDRSGNIIGQTNWVPNEDSSFIGIDTLGVSIGMIAYGNDNLFAGETYNVGGMTIFSDSWVWAGPAVVAVPEPSSLALAGLGGIGLIVSAIRRRRAA